MSDALNQNTLKGDTQKIEINCNSHGRRKFQDIEAKYIKERDLILDLKEIYKNESFYKESGLVG